jgi:hypothetical protein
MNEKLAKLLLSSNLSVEERISIASAIDLLKVITIDDLKKYGIGTRWQEVAKESL